MDIVGDGQEKSTQQGIKPRGRGLQLVRLVIAPPPDPGEVGGEAKAFLFILCI